MEVPCQDRLQEKWSDFSTTTKEIIYLQKRIQREKNAYHLCLKPTRILKEGCDIYLVRKYSSGEQILSSFFQKNFWDCYKIEKLSLIQTLPRIDTTLINLVSKITYKPVIKWNRNLMLNDSMNLGIWGRINQLWMDWLISLEFECHINLISSKSLFRNQRELTLSPIASKLIYDKFPLPKIQTLFVHLQGARIFSKFDLKASFSSWKQQLSSWLNLQCFPELT